MSGLWTQSFSTVQDLNGKPIVGAKAFFYRGGTSTPLATYQNYDLTETNTNPVFTDGYGRWPAVFFDEDDEFYRVRVTTPGGVILYDAATVPIIGPSTGGGGGGGGTPVDPDSLLKTGDVKPRYDEGYLPGWVRMNGRSIGSAVSGADERANADTQALFEHLWNKNPNLAVSGGRGATASIDFGLNKRLSLPNGRGRALVGLDNMGNTAAGIIDGLTSLGQLTGTQTVVLTLEQIPPHTHDLTIDPESSHRHQLPRSTTSGDPAEVGFAFGPYSGPGPLSLAGSPHTHTGTIGSRGGGSSHTNVQPSLGITLYIRL